MTGKKEGRRRKKWRGMENEWMEGRRERKGGRKEWRNKRAGKVIKEMGQRDGKVRKGGGGGAQERKKR